MKLLLDRKEYCTFIKYFFLFFMVGIIMRPESYIKLENNPDANNKNSPCSFQLVTNFLPNSESIANGDEILFRWKEKTFLKIVFIGYKQSEESLIYQIVASENTQLSFESPALVLEGIKENIVFSYKFLEILPIKRGERKKNRQFLCQLSDKKDFFIDIYVDKNSFKYFTIEEEKREAYGKEVVFLLKRKLDKFLLNAYDKKDLPPPYGKKIQDVELEDIYFEVLLYCKNENLIDDDSNFFRFKLSLPVGGSRLNKVMLQ